MMDFDEIVRKRRLYAQYGRAVSRGGGLVVDLNFVTGSYRIGKTITGTLSALPGYAQSATPTITGGVGYVHASGDNVRISGLAIPSGDFTLIVDALGPATGAVVRVAATLDGGGDSPTDRCEVWRSNSGDDQRLVVYNAGVVVVDTVTGTGTPAVGPQWVAGESERLGIVRVGGIIRPYIEDVLQTGTVTYAKSLNTLRLGHRWFGAAEVGPFASTIQRIRILSNAKTGAEIAA
jgi:hypothetical protein